MANDIQVSISQIREVVIALLDHVRDTYGESIELESDYFWSIPDNAKFNVYDKPEELTIGQISEVCGNISRLLDSQADLATYQLRWFAQLLEAIAYEKPG